VLTSQDYERAGMWVYGRASFHSAYEIAAQWTCHGLMAVLSMEGHT